MSRPPAVRALALALLLSAASASSAAATTTTVEPAAPEARTFATTNGGWTSAVDYGSLTCIPGVTCPPATPSYRSTGGSGGAADGYLRSTFGTLLGVLSTTTIGWTSPSFVAPAATDEATLALRVRPQIASLLAIGSVRLAPSLIDVDDPTRSIALNPQALTVPSSTFSAREFAVPAAAIVAGRTYRLRIDVSHTTNVSAVTSGNVDLDDVVLTLTDLTAPVGLTAAVPGTGLSRVTGEVDAAGRDTDVVVDYGSTTAYGTTTAAVRIAGGTVGPQAFAIPLGALTPGATYHYRVTATNAGGDTSTSDATFVAPTPPVDTAPTVTGAADGRTRTVGFVRGARVTDAAVELRDDAGRLVDTVPDADDDGEVTVELPDADGDYAVRVVRENDAGLRSSSADVPVSLDRVAPDPGGDPEVAGDADALVVAFERAVDTVAAEIEVLDDTGTVVLRVPVQRGDRETVRLPAAPGRYTLRVVQRDAAGNRSVTGATTADRAAPVEAPAPSTGGSAPGPTPAAPVAVPSPATPAAAVPAPCTRPTLVLTRTATAGSRVRVSGWTAAASGTRVSIVDLGGRRVGSAVAGASGAFVASVPAPRTSKARSTAGWRAVAGTQRSPAIVLRPDNRLRSVVRDGATTTIRGRVDVRRVGRVTRIEAFGGTGDCPATGAPMRAAAPATVDPRTGAYELRIATPADGRLVVRVRVQGRRGLHRSGYAVR